MLDDCTIAQRLISDECGSKRSASGVAHEPTILLLPCVAKTYHVGQCLSSTGVTCVALRCHDREMAEVVADLVCEIVRADLFRAKHPARPGGLHLLKVHVTS